MVSLIIDVGSSSVRAVLMDAEFNLIEGASAQRTYQFNHQPPGAATVDALMLRDLTEACITELLQHPHAGAITAVGMATFVGNLLGVDRDNVPLTPIYTYADVRSVAHVAALKNQVDAAALHQRTGCILHTAYHPARLRWLQYTQPAHTYQAVHQWLDFATYLYRAWLNPDTPTSYSVMSWSGLLHRETLTWEPAWLDVLGLEPQTLPPLAEFSQVQAGLQADYRARWPQLRDVPFYLAVGDGAAANVGSGGTRRDRPVLTVGTTSALRIITDAPVPPVPAGLWGYRVDAHHHLIGGATSEGGNIFQWAQATLALSAEATEAYLLDSPPGAHGLICLPLLAGERSPGWQAGATGTLHGITLATTPEDMLQAALEGVALRLASIADQLITADAQVYASGGALVRSPAWAQIIANALNRPVHLLQEHQVTARGVAMLLHQWPDSPAQPAVSRILQPQATAVIALQEARARQEALYQLLYDSGAET